MSITIDGQACNGCGKCREVCPGNLLYKNAYGKTEIPYPRECWGCTSCVKECDRQAIHYYLGLDMGGKGHFMYTKRQGTLLHWVIVAPDGCEQVITTDQRKGNAY